MTVRFFQSAYSDRSNTSWRQRLELMWRRDEYGSYSPEADFVLNSSMSGLALGVLVGGYLESRSAIRLFLDKNKHEMFRFPREAQAAMQDRMVMGQFWDKDGGVEYREIRPQCGIA